MWKFGIIHLTLLHLSYAYLGWLYGTLFLVAFVHAADYILSVFGYRRLNFGDLTMSYEYPGVNHNVGGYFKLEKLDFETFQKEIKTRGIKNISKMSSVQVKKFGFTFWKNCEQELAEKQIMRVSKTITTDQDCIDYANEILNEEMDFTKPLWEFRLLENFNEDSSVVFVRMHHSFTDGMGFVSLMSCINDDKFKLTIDKKFPTANIFLHILLRIFGPIYCIYLTIWLQGISSDNDAAKIRELRHKDTHNNKFYAGEEVPFESLRKVYKQYEKYTFNDYMMGVLSFCMAKWYKNNGFQNAHKLKTVVSVNTRPLPKGLNDLKLDNNSVAVKFEFPIRSDFKTALKETRSAFKKYFNFMTLLAINKFADVLPYLPEALGRLFIQTFYSGVDMVYSNVPFSEKPWHFCDKEVDKFGVFAHTQYTWPFFFVIMSYKKKVRLSIVANEGLKMNPQELLDMAYEKLNQDIDEISKTS